jgi:hypothetical protein
MAFSLLMKQRLPALYSSSRLKYGHGLYSSPIVCNILMSYYHFAFLPDEINGITPLKICRHFIINTIK